MNDSLPNYRTAYFSIIFIYVEKKRTRLHWLVNLETSSTQQPRAHGAPTAGPVAKEVTADAAPQGGICSVLERCLCDKQFHLYCFSPSQTAAALSEASG